MSTWMRFGLVMALLFSAAPVLSVQAQDAGIIYNITADDRFPGCAVIVWGVDLTSDGVVDQVYRKDLACLPPPEIGWNGDVVVYAHGYVAFNEPIDFPVDQLVLEGINLPEMLVGMGYAFLSTTYHKNGLAVQEGLADVVELTQFFANTYPVLIDQMLPGYPVPAQLGRVYLVGPSEGGLITTLGIELFPEIFAGGLSVCGPIGSFQKQINYWGDFRVVFDYYFKDSDGSPLIPNPNLEMWPGYDPHDLVVPDEVIAAWPEYEAAALGALTDPANISKLTKLTKIVRLPYDPANPVATRVASAMRVLWYDVFAQNDGSQAMAGQPFTNVGKRYTGTGSISQDYTLNRKVQRVYQTSSAEIMRRYETTGRLARPLVTIHTLYDPEVPYWHEAAYMAKLARQRTPARLFGHIPVNTYGHCAITSGQAVAGFAWLVFKATGELPQTALDVLPSQTDRIQYQRITAEKVR